LQLEEIDGVSSQLSVAWHPVTLLFTKGQDVVQGPTHHRQALAAAVANQC
jgi:hypothetical protein